MKYKSEILEVIHHDVTAMFKIGAISTAKMREFDAECLVQPPETVKKAAKSAKMEHISHAAAGI
jgi:putative transcriptional regulator